MGFVFLDSLLLLTSWDWREYYSLWESRFCRSDGGNVLIWRCVLDHYWSSLSWILYVVTHCSHNNVSFHSSTNIQYTAVLTLSIPYNTITILIWWFLFVLKKDWNQKCKESHWNWLKCLKVAKEKGMGINFYFSGLIFEVVLHSEMPNNLFAF